MTQGLQFAFGGVAGAEVLQACQAGVIVAEAGPVLHAGIGEVQTDQAMPRFRAQHREFAGGQMAEPEHVQRRFDARFGFGRAALLCEPGQQHAAVLARESALQLSPQWR